MGRPGSKPAGFGHKAGLLWTRYGSTATMLTAGTRVPHTSPSATEVRSSVQAEGYSRVASLTTAVVLSS